MVEYKKGQSFNLFTRRETRRTSFRAEMQKGNASRSHVLEDNEKALKYSR